ncbi:MAG: type II toxin-antitoxin system HicB family antitoxin [Clostridia bacterium]
MIVHVGVEVDRMGQAMAWVAELPGCYARGRTSQEAVAKIPLAVEEYCVWLRAHGEELQSPGTVEVAALESVQVESDLGLGLSSGLFSFDRQPVEQSVSALALRAASYARADLMSLVIGLGPTAPSEPLEGTTRTLAQTLDHLVVTDLWYAIRLLPPNALEERAYLLSAIRDACLPAMAEWADESEPATPHTYPSLTLDRDVEALPGESASEAWTGYKVLRRYVWHDRLHYRALMRRTRSQA